MPKFSFLIPHHQREQHLVACLASIHAAMGTDGDYEVVIAGRIKDGTALPDGSPSRLVIVEADPFARVELGPNEPPPFHKTHLLNLALEASSGDVITCLDADAVLGPKFRENFARLEDDSLVKLCYRVRYASYCPWPGEWADRFERYDCGSFQLAFEAYQDASQDWSNEIAVIGVPPINIPFGNSQFSIRRDKLGDLRWDERYFGRGYDDLHFNRAIAEAHGEAYRCQIVTDGLHAMFHIKHQHTPGFDASRWNKRNQRIYHGQATTWYVCPDLTAAEMVRAEVGPHCVAVWAPNDRWLLSEVIPGLDKVIHVGEEAA